MSKRTAVGSSLLLGIVALAFSGFSLVLNALNRSIPLNSSTEASSLLSLFVSLLVQATFSTMGTLIVSHRRDNVIGWIFNATGLLLGLSSFAEQYAIHALLAAPGSLVGGEIAAWVVPLTDAPLVFPLFISLLLLFPTGRLLSHRWRVVLWLAAGAAAALLAVSAFMPGQLDQDTIPIINPFGIGALGGVLHLLQEAGWLFMFATLIAATTSLVLRYRRATGEERQQIKWFAGAGVLVAAVLLANPVTTMGIPTLTALWELLFSLAIAAVPIAAAIAILKYRLYGIDIIIRRTLIYGALTAIVVGVYFLVVGSTSVLLQTQNNLFSSILALGLIALLFQPLRQRLQQGVNRLMPLEPHQPPSQAVMPAQAAAPQERPPLLQPTITEAMVPSEPQSASPRPFTSWLAWSLWVLYLALAPLTLLLQSLNHPFSLWAGVVDALVLLAFATVGALVASRRPEHPIGWLFCAATFLWALGNFALEYAVYTLVTAPGALPGGEGMAWLGVWAHVFGYTPFVTFVFLLFPDGQLPSPRWRPVAWLTAGNMGLFIVVSALTPATFDFRLPSALNPLGIEIPADVLNLLATVYLLLFGASVAACVASVIFRFRRAKGDERQQLKWFAYAGVLGIVVICALVVIALLKIAETDALLFTLAVAGIPIAAGIAILKYRLYDIDIIIRRTLIYGALIGGLALLYYGSIALLQVLSQALTGPQSTLVIVATTLVIAGLFNPVRRRLQDFIDRRFYREKVDSRQALTAFAREVRTLIDLPELLRALVTRTTDLLHITHGAVFLVAGTEGTVEFRLAEGRNLPSEAITLAMDDEMLARLHEGQPISQPEDKTFPLLVSLIAPTAPPSTSNLQSPTSNTLIGVLAFGPRLSEQNYSREDQTLLTGLADQAGTAIYVAQLIQEKQAEAARREESERQLEAYHNSPMGRAEALTQELINRPETALLEIHALAQDAGQDPDTAHLLEHLSRAISYLGPNLLTGLADGYHFIFASQSAPELLPVGLRTLTEHLSRPEAASIQGATEALALYQLCQQALEANSIPQIADYSLQIAELINLQPLHPSNGQPNLPFLEGLAHGLAGLRPAAEALHAYERVDTPQDKLAYLASAVERLSHGDRLARAELGSADRPIIQRVAATWLAVVTGAMSELQTRARVVCHLLTRHTWLEEIIPLTLTLRNEGRGAALKVKVSLAPAPEYTLLDETGQIDRLSAGEERQVELRVRPRLAQGVTQFRARFVILYDDPRGPEQVESFADVVYLLAEAGEFRFIANPYVVGTPLQTGSSLFFGREDVIAFIQENLAAAHQNNLVLIGQRRTGKTSLLKQLPIRLGDAYMPVYLDGQSLALDPGLSNFFYSLATEIAFALEDKRLEIGDWPDLSGFVDGPALAFERKFLSQVRQAIGDRHLLLLLDEFEELETAVRRGNLDSSIFGFLRHLIQHTDNLSVIFCGTHRMEELAADYWSVLFNISLHRHIAFLNQSDATQLIQEPVAAYGMCYDDLALDKMWRVTSGHPYFLQLLCHSLVNRHNKTQRNYVTVADVNAALDEILASGEAHFVFLWTESTDEERLVLTALSRMIPLTGQATPAQVTDYLAERGINLSRQVVTATLHHLVLRDVLWANVAQEADADGVETYRWQLGLLGLWVEKYKSLSRVVDEERRG